MQEYTDYADYYDELMGDSDEEDIDDTNLNKDEINQEVKKEHVLPVLQWLKDQPEGKKHVIKIANLPRQANEVMIQKMINKKIKNLVYEKFQLSLDTKKRQNLGVAHVVSDNFDSIVQLLNLHYHVSSSTISIQLLFQFLFSCKSNLYVKNIR